jgi:hypothetical protein
MLSEALQRNATYEARLSNISIVALDAADKKRSEIPRLRWEWQKVIWSDRFQVVNVKSTPVQAIAP